MDCTRIGLLLRKLRTEKGMTQKQLAEALCLSDKTVSKWERGLGCPDVSLLSGLSRLLGVNMEELLAGELDPKAKSVGNMRKARFYRCPCCGNIIVSTEDVSVACCGRRMEALTPQKADAAHRPQVELVEDENYITVEHPMTKQHHLCFIAYVTGDRLFFTRLYPEGDAAVRFKQLGVGLLYVCCAEHGLFYTYIK